MGRTPGARRADEERSMEPKRQLYHVMPEGSGWKVEREGAPQPLTRTATKEEAIAVAKKLAKASGLALVLIHRDDSPGEQ